MIINENNLNSTNVKKFFYDFTTNTLKVEFVSGEFNEYQNVPQDLYEGLVSSSSVDHFFNENIKNNYQNLTLIKG